MGNIAKTENDHVFPLASFEIWIPIRSKIVRLKYFLCLFFCLYFQSSRNFDENSEK